MKRKIEWQSRWLTRAVVMVGLTGCAWAQTIDLSSLDKLAAKASEVNKVSLDKGQLQAALSLLSSADRKTAKDMDQVRGLVEKLTGVEVRNYEFADKNGYQDSDLAPIREQFNRLKHWSKVIDTKEKNEHSEIYMSSEDGKVLGLGIISAEASEVSVVVLKGSPDLKDLGGLNGVLGLPSIHLGPPYSSAKPEKGAQ